MLRSKAVWAFFPLSYSFKYQFAQNFSEYVKEKNPNEILFFSENKKYNNTKVGANLMLSFYRGCFRILSPSLLLFNQRQALNLVFLITIFNAKFPSEISHLFFFWNKTLSTTLHNVVFYTDPKKTRMGKIPLKLVVQQKPHTSETVQGNLNLEHSSTLISWCSLNTPQSVAIAVTTAHPPHALSPRSQPEVTLTSGQLEISLEK